MNKIKLLTISDFPLFPSGVGTQAKYLIEGLLRTGKYTIDSFGAAMQHKNNNPVRIQEYGDDWTIFPTIGYGDPDLLRKYIAARRPDAIWFITDPRQYYWLFGMADEIRDAGIPLLYWHVWDNYPVPTFNKPLYDSCDFIGSISKLTHDIVQKCGTPEERCAYIPHAVDAEVFKAFTQEEILTMREQMLGPHKNKFIIFYNSRNARRKMTSDVLKATKELIKQVGSEKVFLLMKTDPKDEEGANLVEVAQMLELPPDQVSFVAAGVPTPELVKMYNIADITVCHSNNEGFGLSCLESLSCGTPVVATETGGLQDQIKDEEGNVFGVSLKPVSRSLQGSQAIPFIYDDRPSDESVVAALKQMYDMGWMQRKELGRKGREWTLKAFNLSKMISDWDTSIEKTVTRFKNTKSSRVKIEKV